MPTRTGSENDWHSISSRENHSLGLKSDGSLWGWGYNLWGYLGDGTTNTRFVPTRVGTANDWTAVNVGRYHTLAQKSDGSLWACGYNGYGALGDGTMNHSSTLVPVNFSAAASGP